MIRPLFDYVLVEPIKKPLQTEAGVYIPEIAEERVRNAEVIAVGPGRQSGSVLMPTVVKIGDVVLYPRNIGLKIGSRLLMRESDILAVLE